MNGRDTKSMLLVTLALTAASSPLDIYGEKLQDARRWYERGREAMAKCHPQRGAGDARENCAPLLVDDVLTPDEADLLVAAAEASGAYRRPNPAHRTEELPAFLTEKTELVAKAQRVVIAALQEHCGAGELIEVATLVKKYDASAPGSDFGAGLPQHKDHGRFSATVLIGDDFFGGGGTRFEDLGITLFPAKGSAVIHGAMVRHGSDPAKKGVRVILALFFDEDHCNVAADFQLSLIVGFVSILAAIALGYFLLVMDFEETAARREAPVEAAMATARRRPGAGPCPLETDDTVALLVISRSPRASHAALAAVCKRFATIVLSPKGRATLRKERIASDWLDGAAAPRYEVSLQQARSLLRRDDSLGWLFSGDRPRCSLLLCSLVTMKKPDAQTALTEYFVAIVGDFYSLELTRLRMRVDPRRYIVGYWNFQEPRGGLGADFSDHLLFFAKVIDYIVANYVRADAESGARDTMSYYGRRLVEFGLLGEHFDERTETWTIDTDGDLIRKLRILWGATAPSDAPCPFDAATVVVYAYIAVMTNEAARAKLLAEYCGDGRPGIVIGGLLDVFLNPGGGRVAAVSDVLTTMVTAVAAEKSPTCPIA